MGRCSVMLEGVFIRYLWHSVVLKHVKVHSTCHCFFCERRMVQLLLHWLTCTTLSI
jgi:hypothetical protein